MTFNLLTCGGWNEKALGWFNFGSCMKSKLGIVILFFLLAILNKWVFGMLGLAFNVWIAAGGGILAYLIVIFFIGSFKIALAVGIIAGIILGMLGGGFAGDTAGGE